MSLRIADRSLQTVNAKGIAEGAGEEKGLREPVAIETPGRYRLRNGSYADITEFRGDMRGGNIHGTDSVHCWHSSGRHAGTPELPSYDAVMFIPVAIQRLLDEVRMETPEGENYNRMHNRHNRSMA